VKFHYKKYHEGILRPVIPVEIIYKNRPPVPYEVLVDSGADSCIFDTQIGEILEINIKSGEERAVSGITGTVETYYVHPVTINVGGWSFKINAGFLPNISSLGYGVVGQNGFFDKFVIKFDLVKEEIELKRRT